MNGKIPKILVIGDIMIDEYIVGDVHRVSPEAPVPILLRKRSEYSIGGAGNVAKNVSSLGAKCFICSIVGNDKHSELISEHLTNLDIENKMIQCQDRPTTLKTRIVGNGHQITRIDTESVLPISEKDSALIINYLREISNLNFDAVIFQDYGKGMLTESLVSSAIQIFDKSIILVDPKPDSVYKYVGASIIKPNLSEFKKMCGIQDSLDLSIEDIEKIAKEWISKNSVSDSLLITLSERGMIYISREDTIYSPGYSVPVSDVSGAGDSVIAALSVFLTIPNTDISGSIEMSNLSGAIACQYPGPYSVTMEELLTLYQKINQDEDNQDV